MTTLIQQLNRQLKHVIPIKSLSVKGSKLSFNSFDRFCACLLWKWGLLEGYELELFSKIVQPNHVVLDIGANMGVYSLLAAKLVGPGGKVHAFEPEPFNFSTLKQNIELNHLTNIELYQIGVFDRDDYLSLKTSALNSGNHQLRDKLPDSKDMVKIPTKRLDDFLGPNFKVDIIKMDIQGAEFNALKGMESILKNNPNVIIFTEIWKTGLSRQGVTLSDWIDFISPLEFKVYLIQSKERKLRLVSLTKEELEKLTFARASYDDANLILSRHTLSVE